MGADLTLRLNGTPVPVYLGENTALASSRAAAAARSADAAAASEAVALAAAGPNYADTAAGLAATSVGETFAVEDGGIVTVYRHDSGPVATELREVLTAPAAASNAAGKGASLSGLEGSGTVQDLATASGIPMDAFPGDDDAKIDAAVAALPADGGTILLPPRDITWEATHAFTETVKLIGHGFSASAGGPAGTKIIKAASVSGPALTLQGERSAVINVGFEGEVGNTGDGILVKAGRVTLSGVSVHRMGQDGIRVGDAADTNCNLFQFDRIFTRENGRHGGYIDDELSTGGPDANGGTIQTWESSSNGGDGLRLYRSWYVTLVGFVPQLNTGYGLNIVNGGSPAFLGSRYHTIVGGEQNEANVSGNINNTGQLCNFIGITPGTTLTDSGDRTQVICAEHNQMVGLTATRGSINPVTVQDTSGTTFFPLIVRNYGNTSNGRGVGMEFAVPNGSGTSRSGARIVVEQETTNKDYISFRANLSGVMTELMRLAPNALALDLVNSINLRVNGVQVVGPRKTGWSTMTGTAARTAAATHTAQTISASPTQAQVQNIDNSLVIVSQRLKALIDDLHNSAGHGAIGT